MNLNPLKWSLHWQILGSLTLSFIAGIYILPILETSATETWIYFSDFIGDLFMNALKMMIIPLIITSMVAGVMQLGSHSGVGRIGFKTTLYYTLSGLFAVLIGLLLVNLLQPGNIDKETATIMLGEASNTSSEKALFQKIENRGSGDLWDIFKRMLPSNIFNAASDNGQLLGIIIFSILYGLFAGKLPEQAKSFQLQFWESSQSIILSITEFIIRFAPIGVFALVLPIIYNAPIGELVNTLLLCFLKSLLKVVHSNQSAKTLQDDATRYTYGFFHRKLIGYTSADNRYRIKPIKGFKKDLCLHPPAWGYYQHGWHRSV
jgi:proton glutamate symport protein